MKTIKRNNNLDVIFWEEMKTQLWRKSYKSDLVFGKLFRYNHHQFTLRSDMVDIFNAK